jgi:hypothetical protein
MEHSPPFRNHRRPLAASRRPRTPVQSRHTAGAPNPAQTPAARCAADRQFRKIHLPAASASCTPPAFVPAPRPAFNLFTAHSSGLGLANARLTTAPPPACARARPSRPRRRRQSARGSRGRTVGVARRRRGDAPVAALGGVPGWEAPPLMSSRG